MADSTAPPGDQTVAAPPDSQFLPSMDLTVLTEEQRGAAISVRMLEAEVLRRGDVSPEEVKASVADLLPPATLFGTALLTLPYFHRELRNVMTVMGAPLTMHSSRRIMMTLATNIYAEAEDRSAAVDLVKAVEAEGRRRPQPDGSRAAGGIAAADSSLSAGKESDRCAHNVAMRFRDAASKFSGGLGENWSEYVAEYQQVARDYGLTSTQKLNFLHNLLRGDAKRFYLDRVAHVGSFAQAVEQVSLEYNSVVRQNRVKAYLSGLRMATFTAKGHDATTALERTYHEITRLSPQVPQSHHGDAHKVDFLRNAVVGNAWATEPLSRIATHRLSFQQLYGELEAALHLHKEAQLAVIRDGGGPKSELGAPDTPGILFEGQGRYVRRNVDLGRRLASSGSKSGSGFDPLSLMGCFNCDDPGHRMSECPRRVDMFKASKKKMEYFAKKRVARPAAAVLYVLCAELNEAASSDAAQAGHAHDDSAATEEVLLFDALVEAAVPPAPTDCSADAGEETAPDFAPRD